jgi:two-component system, chemotaxis family, CheB/CheR fusion protein
MNEELQSTNEELQTMNDELRLRGDELNQVNAFLESILTSWRGAVVVVDNEMKVLIWNHAAEDLWGLREDEVRGKNLLGLDIGLPTERLKAPIRSALGGAKRHTTVTLEAVNRRGRHIRCAVTVSPLMTRAEAIHGAILLIDEREEQDRQPSGDGRRAAKPARQDAKRSR